MVVDMGEGKLVEMKVLTLQATVLSVAFGPFDNGYLWLGLNDGSLIAFDYPGLE